MSRALRIAVAGSFPGFPVAAEISATVESLAAQLASAGATVEEANGTKLRVSELRGSRPTKPRSRLVSGEAAGAWPPPRRSAPPPEVAELSSLFA